MGRWAWVSSCVGGSAGAQPVARHPRGPRPAAPSPNPRLPSTIHTIQYDAIQHVQALGADCFVEFAASAAAKEEGLDEKEQKRAGEEL